MDIGVTYLQCSANMPSLQYEDKKKQGGHWRYILYSVFIICKVYSSKVISISMSISSSIRISISLGTSSNTSINSTSDSSMNINMNVVTSTSINTDTSAKLVSALVLISCFVRVYAL